MIYDLNSIIISRVLRILHLKIGFNHCMMKYSMLIDSLSSNPFSLTLNNLVVLFLT